MLELIKNNPFRILGVYANASIKDITSNKSKFIAYAKVNKSITLPSDCVSRLGEVDRSEQNVLSAEHEITLPDSKMRYALFWFVNDGPIADVALANIQEGSYMNTIKAIDILYKKPSFSSWVNLSTLSIMQGDVENTISSMLRLVTNQSYCLQFSSSICGDNYKITPARIWAIYISELLEVAGWKEILNATREHDESGVFYEYVEQLCVDKVVEQIESEIIKAKIGKEASPEDFYKAGKTLIKNTKSIVDSIEDVFDSENIRLQSVLDELATQILQCGINFYNASDDPFEAKKAMQLQEFAEKIAVGKLVKDRCKKNTDILRKIIADLPSDEVRNEWKQIQLLIKQAGSNSSVEETLSLLKKSAPILLDAKERLGKTNVAYTKLATLVANVALNKVIDCVNAKINELNNPILGRFAYDSFKKILKAAWVVIKTIESLDVEVEFKTSRLSSNKKTLIDLVRRAEVYVGDVVSCIDMRTDDDIFNECRSKESYESYCKKYPRGKHYSEAQDKISILVQKEKRSKRIVWSIVAIVVLAIAGFITWSVLTADDRSFENAQNSKLGLTNYLNQWPDGKHRDEAISDLYAICEEEGLASLYKFSEDYSTHPIATEAKQKVDAKCDSLYNVAKAKRTLSGWDEYAAAVPVKYHRDYEKKKQEICDSLYKLADSKHTLEAWDEYAAKVPYKYQKDYQKKKQAIREENERKKWRTESTAWSAASIANTIDMYNKYLEFHPYGAHAAQARKRIIDLRVSNVLAGDYGSLPEMDRTYYGGGTTSSITVHNDTGYTLTLLYSGSSQSKEIIISAGGYKTFSLANGYYRVVASVNAARVSNYAGNEQLSGGGYEVTYYIVTHRF